MSGDHEPVKETAHARGKPLGFVHFPAEIVARHTNAYALRVIGDCMSGDHIRDRDYVLVDPDEEARDGDIAVVRIANWRRAQTGELAEVRAC